MVALAIGQAKKTQKTIESEVRKIVGKENKEDWLKIKVDKIELPTGLKLQNVEVSDADLQALKMLRAKMEKFLEDIYKERLEGVLGGFLQTKRKK